MRFVIGVACILSVTCFTHRAYGQDNFKPVGEFTFKLGNGADMAKDVGNNSAINGFLANQALAGYGRQMAYASLAIISGTNVYKLAPIKIALNAVELAQWQSNVTQAKSSAANAKNLFDTTFKKSDNPVGAVIRAAAYSGMPVGSDYGNYINSFVDYVEKVRKNVDEAQNVPAKILAFLESDKGAANLRNAAQKYIGQKYEKGMQCSDLIIKASHDAGISISSRAKNGQTITDTWFDTGMGKEFQQVYGGNDGVSLGTLVQDGLSGKVLLARGYIIVAKGHAAFFDGFIQDGSKYRIVLWDSNATDMAWEIVYTGDTTALSPDNKTLGKLVWGGEGAFVGMHVSGTHWANSHSVKIFRPIGNHGAPVSDDGPFQ